MKCCQKVFFKEIEMSGGAIFSGFTSKTDRITNFPDDCQWDSHFVYFKKSTDSICLHGCCLLLLYRIVSFPYIRKERTGRARGERVATTTTKTVHQHGNLIAFWEALHAQRLYGWAYNVHMCVSVRFAQHITNPIYKRDAIKHKINLLL